MTDDKELEALINQSIQEEAASKKAIDTLHPKDSENKDRLTILTDEEVTSHTIVEWMTKALKTEDHTKGFIIEGLSDKTKALKVSRQGTGRHEVSNIFKPEIMGEILSAGWMPPGAQGMGIGAAQPKRSFFSRFFGVRR